MDFKPDDLSSETDALHELIDSANNGTWTNVWNILGTPSSPKKSYLLNCIPEDKIWGVLHEAVNWNDIDVVSKILAYKNCDPLIKTKDQKTGHETPCEIAKRNQNISIQKLFTSQDNSYYTDRKPLYIGQEGGLRMRSKVPRLVMMTLVAHKDSFHPRVVIPETPFMKMMRNVFQHIDSGENWSVSRKRIVESYIGFDQIHRDGLLKCSTKEEFYSSVINLYLNSYDVYLDTNNLLRKDAMSECMLNGADISKGPFVLNLQTVLLYWQGLQRYPKVTYRHIMLNAVEASELTVGRVITFPSFTTSYYERDVALKYCRDIEPPGDYTHVLLEINNSANCIWQPRKLMQDQGSGTEVIHPAGAMFKVTNQDPIARPFTISLKLLNIN